MTATRPATDVRARVFAAYQREASDSVLHRDHKGRPIRASVFRALRHMYACGIAQDVARGGEPWSAEVERFRVVDAICTRQDARIMRRWRAAK